MVLDDECFNSQPMLVNDQLNQLYIEMELEGLSTKLTLEEGITSSSSSGEEPIPHMSKVFKIFWPSKIPKENHFQTL